jgi:hypothetical protein
MGPSSWSYDFVLPPSFHRRSSLALALDCISNPGALEDLSFSVPGSYDKWHRLVALCISRLDYSERSTLSNEDVLSGLRPSQQTRMAAEALQTRLSWHFRIEFRLFLIDRPIRPSLFTPILGLVAARIIASSGAINQSQDASLAKRQSNSFFRS